MESFIIYLLKSGIWLVVFWGIYWLFLRKETFFKFNRLFLFTGLLASFALAFCQYHYPVFVNVSVFQNFENASGTTLIAMPQSFRWPAILTGIYALGAVVLLLRRFTGLGKMYRLIRKQNPPVQGKPHVITLPEIHSSFSFFGYIFMGSLSDLSETEKRLVLEHETAHVEQRHWIDLVFSQIVCALQWFNPFAWLYIQSIKQNHEFLADRSVIRKGNSQAVYHAALINHAFQAPIFALANSFAQYNKFKRIVMMKKHTSQSAKKWAVLLVVPALAVFLWAFAKPEYRVSHSFIQPEMLPVVDRDTIVIDTDSLQDKVVVLNVGKMKNQKVLIRKLADSDTLPDMLLKGDKITMNSTYTTCDDESESSGTGKAPHFYFIKTKKLDSSPSHATPVFYVNNKLISSIENIPPDEIESVEVFKRDKALEMFGEKGKNGIIRITTKKFIDDSPLFIVDGKEYTDGLDKIDPNDIKELSVLKGESAKAIHGERGKNGVVLITTKTK